MEGISFWWPIWMYRKFRVLLGAEILILITSLISCDSRGEGLPSPKSLCIAEGAPQELSHPRSHFKPPILHLWHWFASVPLLKVGFFPQMSANPIVLPLFTSTAWGKWSRSDLFFNPPTHHHYHSVVYLHHTDAFHRFMSYSFPMKEGQPVQHPARCILSLCDKYGSCILGASTRRIDGTFS